RLEHEPREQFGRTRRLWIERERATGGAHRIAALALVEHRARAPHQIHRHLAPALDIAITVEKILDLVREPARTRPQLGILRERRAADRVELRRDPAIDAPPSGRHV